MKYGNPDRCDRKYSGSHHADERVVYWFIETNGFHVEINAEIWISKWTGNDQIRRNVWSTKNLAKETGGQSDKMAKLFSNSRALTAAIALTGSQYDTFREKTKKMNQASGATEKL